MFDVVSFSSRYFYSNYYLCFLELVDQGVAPLLVPIHIGEGPLEALNLNVEGWYSLTYYLMLLHAIDGKNYVNLSKIFTSFSSTYDVLDYDMKF